MNRAASPFLIVVFIADPVKDMVTGISIARLIDERDLPFRLPAPAQAWD